MGVGDYSEHDVFSTVSKRYDILNQILSLGIDMYWRHTFLYMMLPYIHKGDIVLDLATGTFDIARAIVRRVDATILALDYSLQMLIEGGVKIQEYPNIIPIQADGRSIPLQDESIDVIAISFGIRNIIPRALVFAEWYRLLKREKHIYVLEFCNPEEVIPSLKSIYTAYISKVMPTIASLFGADKTMYTYLSETIHTFPQCEDIKAELCSAGFINITYTKLSFGAVAIYTAMKG